MFSYVRMSDGGPSRYQGPRSEVSILADVALRVFGSDCKVDFAELKSHAAIRDLIARIVPGYENMMGMNETKEEFHVQGRSFTDYSFPTPDGKATFHAPPLPQPELNVDQLRQCGLKGNSTASSTTKTTYIEVRKGVT
jgi:hypothetical protein